MSLNNLSTGWPRPGAAARALAAIDEAVDHPPAAGRGQPRRVPARPRHVAEQPVHPAGRGRAAGGGAGRHQGGRRRIYRRLAEASPAAFLPDLATSLNNLSNRLAEAGRPGGGAGRRSAKPSSIYRRLAEANPAAFLPDLATSLNNLSNRLAEAGDRDGGAGRRSTKPSTSTGGWPRPTPPRSSPTSPRR